MNPISETGVIVVGGGYRYFTNAWINVSILRQLGCKLPIQLWMLQHEVDYRFEGWLTKLDVELCLITTKLPGDGQLPLGTRPEWILKPEALLRSRFQRILFLDADNMAISDPTYLLADTSIENYSGIFWPDLSYTEKERPIWDVMGVPYRIEPEFETGQLIIDKRRCAEPLQLALWMNKKASFFYKYIWGDKDTFRFSWHKFGCPFKMIPFPPQLLQVPGDSSGLGVMCQHDHSGDRIFQHRNMAKWDLLGDNPRIPGFLLEESCRDCLAKLREMWNGQLKFTATTAKKSVPTQELEKKRLSKIICEGIWLFEDRRPRACCGVVQTWNDLRAPKPWSKPRTAKTNPATESGEDSDNIELLPATLGNVSPTTNGESWRIMLQLTGSPRFSEISFRDDSTIGVGAGPGLYWWDIQYSDRGWQLVISGTEGDTAVLLFEYSLMELKGEIEGAEGDRGPLRLVRLTFEYPESAQKPRGLPLKRCDSTTNGGDKISIRGNPKVRQIHVANHAFGIGDAISGLYACAGAVTSEVNIIYHTRFPEWLNRVQQQGIRITGSKPPKSAIDLDRDYHEQIRYCHDKVRWYGQFLTGKIMGKDCGIASTGKRPMLRSSEIELRRLDFEKYILLAPFAAREGRDWPQSHWSRLACLANRAGFEVVAIGTSDDEERIMNTFNTSNAYWAIDHTPDWIQDAMLGAAAVIGLDSGMTHLAGLIGARTFCIHAHLPSQFLFSCAPTVRSISPNTDCVFCRWDEKNGFNEVCATACSALSTIGPELVLSEVNGNKEVCK